MLRTSTKGTRAAVALGVTAGVLGGAMVGGVLGVPGLSSASGGAAVVQQSDDPTDESTGETTGGSAASDSTASDSTVDDPSASDDGRGTELRARMAERLRERLQPLVDDDTITADQADAVADHLVAEAPGRADRGGPFGDRDHRRGEFPGHGGLGLFDPGALAEALGIDLDEVLAELRAGATPRELAGTLGVDVDRLVTAISDAVTERLDAAVERGRLTSEEADERAAALAERIEDFLDRGFPGRR